MSNETLCKEASNADKKEEKSRANDVLLDPATAVTPKHETDVIDTNINDYDRNTVKKHKYDESFIDFGFTWNGNINFPNPVCFQCEQTLSNC